MAIFQRHEVVFVSFTTTKEKLLTCSHLSIKVVSLHKIPARTDFLLQLADVCLEELCWTRLLALLLAVKLVTVPLTASVVEWLTSLLKVVKVPLRDPILTRSGGPGQQTHRPGAAPVLAAVLALGLGDEAVEVALAAAVVELLALLGLLVVTPPREVPSAECFIVSDNTKVIHTI